MFCSYFQACVNKERTWFFVATLRSFEHLQFDRTLDKSRGLFEFFVPSGGEQTFINLMEYYQNLGVVSDFKKMTNRLQGQESV